MNTKQRVTMTVVVTGMNAVVKLRKYPSNQEMMTVVPMVRKYPLGSEESANETCEHLARAAIHLSEEYRIIMPASFRHSLVMRELEGADFIEEDIVHNYESITISGGGTSNTNSSPKVLKKSDKCRAIIAEHLTSPAEAVIALIADQCKLTAGLAKKYYNNNIAKVQQSL